MLRVFGTCCVVHANERNNFQHCWRKVVIVALTLVRLGFLRVAQLGGGGGGRQKVPAAYNSKTVNDNEMKIGGVVKNL